ncbi:hypothetical protein KY285_035164 [Solanum tuberosum]|nr:hypothetical protein KY285_035164 [Solanum tuberosum]
MLLSTFFLVSPSDIIKQKSFEDWDGLLRVSSQKKLKRSLVPEYFKDHAATIQSYMSALDLDLGLFASDLGLEYRYFISALSKMNAKTPAESSSANRPTENDSVSNNKSPDDNEPPETDRSSNTELPKDNNYHGLLIHHQSLTRNKRCLMAYVYNQAEVVRRLGWTLERVLPEEIEEKLSTSEK